MNLSLLVIAPTFSMSLRGPNSRQNNFETCFITLCGSELLNNYATSWQMQIGSIFPSWRWSGKENHHLLGEIFHHVNSPGIAEMKGSSMPRYHSEEPKSSKARRFENGHPGLIGSGNPGVFTRIGRARGLVAGDSTGDWSRHESLNRCWKSNGDNFFDACAFLFRKKQGEMLGPSLLSNSQDLVPLSKCLERKRNIVR